MLGVITLNIIMLRVINIDAIIQSAILLTVSKMLGVHIMNVILLNVIKMIVIILNADMTSVIMLRFPTLSVKVHHAKCGSITKTQVKNAPINRPCKRTLKFAVSSQLEEA